MAWSEKVIDLAGSSFDVLAVHNYEDPERFSFQSGVERIRDYLVKLRDYVRASRHPGGSSRSSNGISAGRTTGAPACTQPAA